MLVYSRYDFNSMLNIGLFSLHVVGAYRIYTEFFPWNFPEMTIYLIWNCTLVAVFYQLLYWTASYLHKCSYVGSIQLLVTHNLFQSHIGKKETHMFYVARIIKFSLF